MWIRGHCQPESKVMVNKGKAISERKMTHLVLYLNYYIKIKILNVVCMIFN